MITKTSAALFAFAAILGIGSLVLSAPTAVSTQANPTFTPIPHPGITPSTIFTNFALFQIPMDQFLIRRNKKDGPSDIDWESDGCSHVEDEPFGFNFKDSCRRHDFGYRNFKKQNRYKTGKQSIDLQFREDLLAQCDTEKHRRSCRFVAKIYYKAVRIYANKKHASAIAQATSMKMKLAIDKGVDIGAMGDEEMETLFGGVIQAIKEAGPLEQEELEERGVPLHQPSSSAPSSDSEKEREAARKKGDPDLFPNSESDILREHIASSSSDSEEPEEEEEE